MGKLHPEGIDDRQTSEEYNALYLEAMQHIDMLRRVPQMEDIATNEWKDTWEEYSETASEIKEEIKQIKWDYKMEYEYNKLDHNELYEAFGTVQNRSRNALDNIRENEFFLQDYYIKNEMDNLHVELKKILENARSELDKLKQAESESDNWKKMYKAYQNLAFKLEDWNDELKQQIKEIQNEKDDKIPKGSYDFSEWLAYDKYNPSKYVD
jgi:hypothetical protein